MFYVVRQLFFSIYNLYGVAGVLCSERFCAVLLVTFYVVQQVFYCIYNLYCVAGVSYYERFCVVLQVTFAQSLFHHPIFSISCALLLLLFSFGIHKRVVAPSMYPLWQRYW